jgi:hypothetical protein
MYQLHEAGKRERIQSEFINICHKNGSKDSNSLLYLHHSITVFQPEPSTRETREGWPQLTVETEANRELWSIYEMGPSLNGFFIWLVAPESHQAKS